MICVCEPIKRGINYENKWITIIEIIMKIIKVITVDKIEKVFYFNPNSLHIL
jgi:hypothetical protein